MMFTAIVASCAVTLAMAETVVFHGANGQQHVYLNVTVERDGQFLLLSRNGRLSVKRPAQDFEIIPDDAPANRSTSTDRGRPAPGRSGMLFLLDGKSVSGTIIEEGDSYRIIVSATEQPLYKRSEIREIIWPPQHGSGPPSVPPGARSPVDMGPPTSLPGPRASTPQDTSPLTPAPYQPKPKSTIKSGVGHKERIAAIEADENREYLESIDLGMLADRSGRVTVQVSLAPDGVAVLDLAGRSISSVEFRALVSALDAPDRLLKSPTTYLFKGPAEMPMIRLSSLGVYPYNISHFSVNTLSRPESDRAVIDLPDKEVAARAKFKAIYFAPKWYNTIGVNRTVGEDLILLKPLALVDGDEIADASELLARVARWKKEIEDQGSREPLPVGLVNHHWIKAGQMIDLICRMRQAGADEIWACVLDRGEAVPHFRKNSKMQPERALLVDLYNYAESDAPSPLPTLEYGRVSFCGFDIEAHTVVYLMHLGTGSRDMYNAPSHWMAQSLAQLPDQTEFQILRLCPRVQRTIPSTKLVAASDDNRRMAASGVYNTTVQPGPGDRLSFGLQRAYDVLRQESHTAPHALCVYTGGNLDDFGDEVVALRKVVEQNQDLSVPLYIILLPRHEEARPVDREVLEWLAKSSGGDFAVAQLPSKILDTVKRRQSLQPSEERTWTDRTGKFTVQAAFAGLSNGVVKLKTSDRTIEVPLERLSKQDQEYLDKRRK